MSGCSPARRPVWPGGARRVTVAGVQTTPATALLVFAVGVLGGLLAGVGIREARER